MKIEDVVRFTDTHGLHYQGQVIDIRENIAYVAVLGLPKLFRFSLQPLPIYDTAQDFGFAHSG